MVAEQTVCSHLKKTPRFMLFPSIGKPFILLIAGPRRTDLPPKFGFIHPSNLVFSDFSQDFYFVGYDALLSKGFAQRVDIPF
jgi:hypothetical protein